MSSEEPNSVDPARRDPIPYEEVTNSSYGERAAADFVAERIGGDVVLSGNCPRCGGPMSAILPAAIVRRPSSPSRPIGEGYEVIGCTCGDLHPERPEDRVGCGAYWTVVVTEVDR